MRRKRVYFIYAWARVVLGLIRRIRKYGLAVAPTYISVKRLENQVRKSNEKPGPYSVECPCCGWQGHAFLPVDLRIKLRSNARCPVCESRERHRAYFLYYRQIENLRASTMKLFLVSPEPCLKKALLETYEGFLLDCDIRPVGVSLQADLTQLAVKDECFDNILCHHVLEHIIDDNAAIQELWRVLRVNGVAYISVPQTLGLDNTEEWGRCNPLVSNHVREYGKDFVERLTNFKVKVIDIVESYRKEQKKVWGLNSQELLYVCKKRKN